MKKSCYADISLKTVQISCVHFVHHRRRVHQNRIQRRQGERKRTKKHTPNKSNEGRMKSLWHHTWISRREKRINNLGSTWEKNTETRWARAFGRTTTELNQYVVRITAATASSRHLRTSTKEIKFFYSFCVFLAECRSLDDENGKVEHLNETKHSISVFGCDGVLLLNHR